MHVSKRQIQDFTEFIANMFIIRSPWWPLYYVCF